MLLKQDANRVAVQGLAELGTTYAVPMSTVSSIVATFGSDAIRISCTADSFFKLVGANSQTAGVSDNFLPAGVVEYLHVGKATNLMGITTSSPAGTFYVSEVK